MTASARLQSQHVPPRLYSIPRRLPLTPKFPLAQAPSRLASNPDSDATRIIHPHPSKCQDNSVRDASPVEPSLETIYHQSCILWIVGRVFSFRMFVSPSSQNSHSPSLGLRFQLSIRQRTTPPASTRLAYLYITLSPGPGEEHNLTHAIEPLFSFFPFACHRLETLIMPVTIPHACSRPFGNTASFPLSFSLAPLPSPRERGPTSDLT